ncbi:MAG TPA: alpha/beta hydrolase [Novosphingobium sp.]|nr:alpha/beta hydrolase [Novosphingobium sp.]
MRRSIAFGLVATALLATGLAQAAPGERLRERVAERTSGEPAQRAARPQTIAYGSDPLQQLDVWKADKAGGKAPLVMYVHGGGWKRGSKETAASRNAPAHFTREGYVYASIDYRLVPKNTVEDQARDVAQALKALLEKADALGIDRSRVVIMGHSAGAHLVALVGTDEQYLRSAGLSFADIDGVIPNDGAAYDVPAQMRQAGRLMQDTYDQAFGTDPARQRALSPTLQAASPNAPAFLLIHVQRKDGVAQARELEAALRRAGTAVERREFAGQGLRGHMEINRNLGDPDYPATPVVDSWLKRIFAR